MSSNDDDQEQRFILGVIFGVVALVVGLVIGVGIYKTGGSAQPAPAAAASAPAADASAPAAPADEARVVVTDGVVKFYFASGSAALASGANEALADAVKAVADGKRLLVSGFHDATGDAAKNAELAKQRAMAVGDALKALGVADDKVELKKPEEMTGTGSNAEARRVEVSVQ